MARATRKEKQNPSSADTIYNTLRDRICLHVYPQGSILKEADIAKEFSVSRTPVRESLQKLKQDGLIESRKKVGTVVIGIDKETTNDIYLVRLYLLDCAATESNAQFSEKHIAVMSELESRVKTLFDRIDTEEYWKINDVLHKTHMAVIQNKTLKTLLHKMFLQTARSWAVLLPKMWDISCELLLHEIVLEKEFMKLNDRAGVFTTLKSHAMLSLKRCNQLFDG